ncbi:MAG TPA: hypothetical protein VMV29_21120 [Ktedonobacterales bacterium]|nr:hypothetical protein [Ktedonobacterales bacterium]
MGRRLTSATQTRLVVPSAPPSVATAPTVHTPQSEALGQRHDDPRLAARWLPIARVVWAALTLALVGVFAVAIPTRYRQLFALTQVAAATLTRMRVAQGPHPTDGGALDRLALSALASGVYPVVALALEVGLTLACVAAALVIFWRRSDSWIAIFAALTLVGVAAATAPALDALAQAQPIWRTPVAFAQGVGLECEPLIFYLSPDGRFIPRWTRPLAVIWTLIRLATLVLPFAPFHYVGAQPGGAAPTPLAVFGFLVYVGWLGSGLWAQLYRHRRVSTLSQRQQTKWAMLGAVFATIGYITFILPRLTIPALNAPGQVNLIYTMIGAPLYMLSLLLVPLFVAFSILRYRLWDVDIVINRALVYGALAVTLAAIFFASVVALQTLTRPLTGQQSSLTLIASTLVIALVYQPLLNGIQRIIDRRFYPRKYDNARTLAAFSASLRDEVDLDRLGERLVAVIDETMAPTHSALWLRPPRQEARQGWRPLGPAVEEAVGATGLVETVDPVVQSDQK